MERAALIFGVLLAAGFLIFGAVERSGGVVFQVGDAHRDELMEAAPGELSATIFAGDAIRIVRAAAVLRILPEDRADISVEIVNPGRTPMPEVDADEGEVVIDGLLGGRIEDCLEGGDVMLDGYGLITRADLPVITVRAPRTLTLKVDGAVLSDVGALQTAHLSFTGCGDAVVGDVAGALDLNAAGSGAVQVGATGPAEVRLAGAGSVALGAVREKLDLVIAGSGDLRAARLDGELEARSAGSGGAVIEAGAISAADISIAGSGDIAINGPVETLDARIVGSGDIQVAGVVGDVDASIAGSGDIRVAAVTGQMEQRAMGSGAIRVGAAGE